MSSFGYAINFWEYFCGNHKINHTFVEVWT